MLQQIGYRGLIDAAASNNLVFVDIQLPVEVQGMPNIPPPDNVPET